MSRKIIVAGGQSIFDIAIQEYGSTEGVFALIADNNLPDGLATILTAGQQLFIKSDPTDPTTLAAIKAGGIKPKSFGVTSLRITSMDQEGTDGNGRMFGDLEHVYDAVYTYKDGVQIDYDGPGFVDVSFGGIAELTDNPAIVPGHQYWITGKNANGDVITSNIFNY